MTEIQVKMEKEYKIIIASDGHQVRVENISVPNSCSLNITHFQELEDKTVFNYYNEADWKSFICALIEYGLLD